MVKAILEGRKTQTRRVLVCQSGKYKGKQPLDFLPMKVPNEWVSLMERNPNHGIVFKCRYGIPTDQLWVKESWRYYDPNNPVTDPRIDYKADYAFHNGDRLKWHPSIHMFRWMSRIQLEITDVRVHRIQEITTDDCEAEGFNRKALNDIGLHYAFGQLWNQINEKRGYGWATNPFVWAVTFKRIK
jgi:hypothetical protein